MVFKMIEGFVFLRWSRSSSLVTYSATRTNSLPPSGSLVSASIRSASCLDVGTGSEAEGGIVMGSCAGAGNKAVVADFRRCSGGV